MGNPRKPDARLAPLGVVLIQVLQVPLVHQVSGFSAWDPGTYEFPLRPEYEGWLQGQVERGAVSMDDATADAPFKPGDQVLYTAADGSESKRTVKSVNPDGTFNLGGAALKKVPADRLKLVEPEKTGA